MKNNFLFFITLMCFMLSLTQSQYVLAAVETTTPVTTAIDTAKACDILYTNLQRPKLTSTTTTLKTYIDPLTLPQTKTECTHVYVVSKEVKGCVKWGGVSLKYPLGRCLDTGVIVPAVKSCDTWATYKKNMECKLNFSLKLPNFVNKPLSDFLDTSYNTVTTAQSIAQNSLPLECASSKLKANASKNNPGKEIATAIANELKKQLTASIQKQAQDWLATTGIKTVVSAIPTGGFGGVAALATSIAEFVIRVKEAIKPFVQVADNVKTVGQDMGFSTQCGWRDWEKVKI
jgi:hypothetical protein